jgi:4-alpha-glucanotransferase
MGNSRIVANGAEPARLRDEACCQVSLWPGSWSGMIQSPPSDLQQLAAAAGLQRHWRDVEGREVTVAEDALAAVLAALGFDTGSAGRIKAGHAQLAGQQQDLPALIVTETGLPTPIRANAALAELTDEQGVTTRLAIVDGQLGPVAEPGYYDLAVAGRVTRLAVAPPRCPLPAGRRLWGTSVQIPALRGAVDRGFGGFGELAAAAEALAQRGCAALAINPVHALFPGVGTDYSPYSPSSRTYFNAAMADPALLGLPPLPASPGGPLIDWPSAMPQRLAALRASFAGLGHGDRARIDAANAAEGAGLSLHALHDALHSHFRAQGLADWRAWPAAFRNPHGEAAQRFAVQHADDVRFQLYAQWLARAGLAEAQARARAAGMAIGLIADLAVGVHPGGSDCWAMPDSMLTGLTIGAPPDPLGPLGQNWSITGFSPLALRAAGYAPWIAMLRAALRSAGGLRIDHAFGLARLWVIPAGGACADGAYLTYPFLDLVRLVTLEAHRANAMIIAEDLGTAPPGFTQAVTDRNMLGMAVLWFQRAADHGFIGAQDYPANSVAMTGTHDTPTIAGWWRGRDLDWANQLGRLPAGIDRPQAERGRDWDRGLLWSTISQGDRPAPHLPEPAVTAALAHVARSPAVLAMAPVEDLLAEAEQPNLPGTTSEHPNWRRRFAAPLDGLLDNDQVAARVAVLANRG